MPKSNHVPMRTCVVTREKKPKTELVRFVLDSSKRVSLDITGKLRGRGANMTPSLEVYDEGYKKKVLNRAFKINIADEDLKRLRRELKQYIEAKSSLVLDKYNERKNDSKYSIENETENYAYFQEKGYMSYETYHVKSPVGMVVYESSYFLNVK